MQFSVENHTIIVISSDLGSCLKKPSDPLIEYSIDFDLVFLLLWFQFILDLPRECKDERRIQITQQMSRHGLFRLRIIHLSYLLLNAFLPLGKPTTVLEGQDYICHSES